MKTAVAVLLLTGGFTSAQMPFEMAKPGLDVGVVVSDMAKSRRFYGEVLGLKPVNLPPVPLAGGGELVRYASGSTDIKLRTFDSTPEKFETGTMEANGIRLMTMFVEDVDAMVKRIVDSGLPAPQFISPPNAAYKYGFVSDPDGNQIELLSFGAQARPEAFARFQIGLTVSDAEKAREFYGKVLGLKEGTAQPLGTTPGAGSPGALEYFFGAGNTTIKFWAPKSDRPTRTGAIGDALGIRYFTFLVKDVDAAYDALQARGVKVTTPPRDLGAAARIMLVSDPDGNTIEFATRK
jgi:glyoxylase I family protein